MNKRKIVELWEQSDGRCWRCGFKIVHEVYGVGWVLGHTGKAKWAGGTDMAPEHTSCNSEDGREQTKLAAKAIRRRARDIGVKKLASFPKPEGKVKYNWKRRRYERI